MTEQERTAMKAAALDKYGDSPRMHSDKYSKRSPEVQKALTKSVRENRKARSKNAVSEAKAEVQSTKSKQKDKKKDKSKKEKK